MTAPRNLCLLISVALAAALCLLGCSGRKPDARQSSVALSPAHVEWFEDRARQSGVDFQLGHGGKTPLTLLETIGTGCAVFDYDGDGHADLFFVGQTMAGQPGRCRLYHNKGDGTFEDVTRGSGLEAPGFYTGCAVGDIDNDGRPDLLVTGYGVVRLYRNLGGGKFADITRGSGLEAPSSTSWATSAGFADIDHDGKLDVYIGRYVVFNSQTIQFCKDKKDISTACGPRMYDPQVGSLYRNLGNGHFQDVTRQMGLDRAHGKCLGVAFADVNGDGWPDLYLGNDEMPGDLFINQQGKGFKEEASLRGVALSDAGTLQGAMGVDWGDLNHDGSPALAVATFQYEGTSLYTAMQDGTYKNQAIASGIAQATRPNVGFGIKLADFDNDGWLDIAQANGHVFDNEELVDTMSHYRQPIQLFLNDGKGKFLDRTPDAGPAFTTPCVGRALAVGDLDDDGRLDLVVTDLEGHARVLVNRIPSKNAWLRVRLVGTRSNRMGIGARVTAMAGNQRWRAECTTGGSYLAASDARIHFGLGAVSAIDSIEVRWPSGRQSVITSPRLSSDVTITEPAK